MTSENGFGGLFDDTPYKKDPPKKPEKEKKSTTQPQREQFFFETQKEQSEVKAKIVAGYFSAWATFMLTRNPERLGYIDLFCGPGVYKDHKTSTPIMILKTAINKAGLSDKLTTRFNDRQPEFIESLKAAAESLPGFNKLKFKPEFTSEEVEERFAQDFEKIRLHPTLAFLDPCGYKGLSVRLMRSVFKDWGCDLIFFFNYNRVNMHSENPVMEENMKVLFGDRWAGQLKAILSDEATSMNREQIILTILKEALREKGANFFLPFRFKEGAKTLHHIIFISKNVLGYNFMKDIMERESLKDEDGIPLFEFVTGNDIISLSPISSQLSFIQDPKPLKGISQLCELLTREFKGKTLSVVQIFHLHNVDTNYVKRNYKDAIRILEEQGRVKLDEPASVRKKQEVLKFVNGKFVREKQVTVADPRIVTFV